jgi:RNA polymerase sigma-70 factor (ECF subfamily)
LAIAEWKGPAAALEIVNALAADGRLAQYQPYWAARAALLARTHAYNEAHDAYDIAIGLERDPDVRRFLQARQAALPR